MRSITIALAGNPNSGKTSIFNRLTGARQHVGNYPGVTVESKEGRCSHAGVEINIVDLPGAYSLTAHSLDELLAREFILDRKPDVVVNILDASNLERNLYLTTQILELGARMVLVLNMSDLAEGRGIRIDAALLSELLGSPTVSTVGNRGEGIQELLDAIVRAADEKERPEPVAVRYGRDVERRLARLTPAVAEKAPDIAARYGARWLALKLLEKDEEVRGLIESEELLETADEIADSLQAHSGLAPEIMIAEGRYGFISGVGVETVRTSVEALHNFSDKVDTVLLNRVLGLPIFLILMYLVFHMTFTLGEPVMGWIEALFGWTGGVINGWLPRDSTLRSLLVDGVIGGVGGVVVFLPNILLLFMAIAVLEDTGYMARAAFLMDRFMHRIGLHGKSFIPMLIGFGCSVPAIMATRTLESRRDRLVTMMIAPLMSCGARFPIYALIIPAFFPARLRGPMLWLIYVIGIVIAIVAAKVLRVTVLRGESHPLVMELPPYHVPTIGGVLIHMWERGWQYVKKAGTIILAAALVLWVLTSYPKKSSPETDYNEQAQRIERAFAQGAAELTPELGLAADSPLLTRLLVTEQRYELAPDDRAAMKAKAKESYERAEAAVSASPEATRIRPFLEIRNAILAIRRRFKETVKQGGFAPESPEYVTAAVRRDQGLLKVERMSPKLFAAASSYLDKTVRAYHRDLRQIENDRRAEELSYSYAGRIGHAIEPLLRPLGFDWRIGTALIGATAAKEIFVSQLAIVHSLGETGEQSEALRRKLRERYSPLAGLCIMLFCLISTPCIATVVVTVREAGSWKWGLFQWAGLTGLAYLVTLIVYQVGRLLGLDA